MICHAWPYLVLEQKFLVEVVRRKPCQAVGRNGKKRADQSPAAGRVTAQKLWVMVETNLCFLDVSFFRKQRFVIFTCGVLFVYAEITSTKNTLDYAIFLMVSKSWHTQGGFWWVQRRLIGCSDSTTSRIRRRTLELLWRQRQIQWQREQLQARGSKSVSLAGLTGLMANFAPAKARLLCSNRAAYSSVTFNQSSVITIHIPARRKSVSPNCIKCVLFKSKALYHPQTIDCHALLHLLNQR